MKRLLGWTYLGLLTLSLSAYAAPPPTGVVKGRVKLFSRSLLGNEAVKSQDAVVYAEAPSSGSPGQKSAPPKMVQRNKSFEPGLLVIPTGTTVVFPNDDEVFHNVFSLSEGNQFDLGLYAQGKAKAVRFTKPGAVDVFCNIHPQMIGAILVLDTPHHVRIAEDGTFELKLPAGKQTLVAWWMKGAEEKRTIEVPAGGEVSVEFELVDTGSKARHTKKDGQAYGRYK